MLVSVITPTYNRAGLLRRLYISLTNQTNKDFEWIIVDDGSEDETPETVKNFIAESKLPIRYFRKKNGGKHTAVNTGVREADGELSFIADSDDWLPPHAIDKVIQIYSTIKGNPEFAGVCGLDGLPDGSIIGNGLPKEIIDASYLEIREQLRITGDMKEVYLTSVMRQFPFPEIEGERFCSEALVWNRIASKYKLRFFNDIIYFVEYQSDGITSSITKARMKNPSGAMMTYSEWIRYKIPFKRKIRYALNYWRFAFCADKRSVGISRWTIMLAPLGWIMHIIDRHRLKS